ncbi:MAG: hypothetical protein J6T98_12790 [Salinivirgaceae bacterium]|nr:hypothetical protein [Salinivirgaceae bacterium]
MRLFVSAVAIAAFIMTSCQSSTNRIGERHGGTLRVNISDIPHSIFPGQVEKRSEQIIVRQVYCGLVKYNQRTLEIVPSIAKDYNISPDELTYTFSLNTQARFPNDRCFAHGKGRRITAADVKYSIEQICRNKLVDNHGISSQISNICGAVDFLQVAKNNDSVNIAGIVAKNDSTLIINLKSPDKLFIHFLAGTNALVFAREAFNAYGTNGTVGSGPFLFKYPKIIGQTINLTRNPNYWGVSDDNEQLPYLDTLALSFITSTQKELYMFGAGLVDAVFDLPTQYLSDFLDANIDKFKSDSPRFIMTNTTKPGNDKRFNMYSAEINGLHFNSQTYFDFSTVYLKNPVQHRAETAQSE